MGINYELYNSSSDNSEIQEIIQTYTDLFFDRKIILSVDRLDYSKGIINRLKAFSLFLEISFGIYSKCFAGNNISSITR